jgi:hypothetical protein
MLIFVGHAKHKFHHVGRIISDAGKDDKDLGVANEALPKIESFGTLAIGFSTRAPGGEFGFDGEGD